MTDAEARRALRAAARAFATRMPDVAKGKGRAYEAWVMLAVARRLVAKGFSVEAVDCAGRPVKKLRLRKNPAPMSSDRNPATSPCHLVVHRRPFYRYEVHLGMQHEGTSGALHEIDLCVVPADPAERLRAEGGGPWSGRTCFALELKAYDEASSLDLGIGRALVGVAHDLEPGRAEVRISVGRGRTMHDTMTLGGHGPRLYLVTSAKLYPETVKLLAGHDGAGFPSVLPGGAGAPLDDLVSDALRSHRCWC